MSIGLILWLLLIVTLGVVLGKFMIDRLKKSYIKQYKYWIDFDKDAYDGSALPVIRVKIRGKYRPFLLDTGCNKNLLSTDALKELPEFDTFVPVGTNTMMGVGHTEKVTNYIVSEHISINKEGFDLEFLMSDALTGIFGTIKEQSGVELIGILGTEFFEQARWMLDLDKKVVWIKN